MDIVEMKLTPTPRYGLTREGYTIRSGAPTSKMVRLAGETRFRRVYCWQFSNAGTIFLKIKGENVIINEFDLPNEGRVQERPSVSRMYSILNGLKGSWVS